MKSNLARREQQIMEVLYRLGEATANEVVAAMPNDPANATVRTQLRILEQKGLVKHRREGKRFIFSPAEPRQSAAASAFTRVLQIFFGGSLNDALAAHLSDPRTKLGDEDFKRLRQLVNQHQPRGKKS